MHIIYDLAILPLETDRQTDTHTHTRIKEILFRESLAYMNKETCTRILMVSLFEKKFNNNTNG